MDWVLNKVCVLVTVAFVLTLLPGFRRRERSMLSVSDQGSALAVFLLLGLFEDAAARHTGWHNERIIALCAGGLLAGPWVGLAVGVFVTALAVLRDGLPVGTIGLAMLCGGLASGWLHRTRPAIARLPVTGFLVALLISWLRNGLTFLFAPAASDGLRLVDGALITPLSNALGTALILTAVGVVRERDEQAVAAASAEVRALQARMNPHFLFNALNALAALSTIAPRRIPQAASRLRLFLRASFDGPDRALVPLEEELAVVGAYLDIERLRFGDRLQTEEVIDPKAAGCLVPPFSLQPLVENAVQHGSDPSGQAGRIRLEVRCRHGFVEMTVRDDGSHLPADEVDRIFFDERAGAHALVLLRRRLKGLFGSSGGVTAESDAHRGTSVTVTVPRHRAPTGPGGAPTPAWARPAADATWS